MHRINGGLLWEYSLDGFDLQEYRREVAERVISMGLPSDWYVAFDLYGASEGYERLRECCGSARRQSTSGQEMQAGSK